MESAISEFDRRIQDDTMDLWRTRLGERGVWNYEVENGDKYVFTLKDGRNLEILDYLIVKKDSKGRKTHLLLSEIDGLPVGILTVSINDDSLFGEKECETTNNRVLTKGLGIGNRMEKVKQFILQKMANQTGSIVNVLDDENRRLMEIETYSLKNELEESGDDVAYKNKVKELFKNRQIWLSIYGPGGKAGYDWSNEFRIVKRFKMGDPLPVLNCEVDTNDTSIKLEIEKV